MKELNTEKQIGIYKLLPLTNHLFYKTVIKLYFVLWSRTLSQLEPEFKSTYRNLSKQVQDFATELLDQTRGSEELETILNHNTEAAVSDDDAEVMTLSRLRLAIKYKQKEVNGVKSIGIIILWIKNVVNIASQCPYKTWNISFTLVYSVLQS